MDILRDLVFVDLDFEARFLLAGLRGVDLRLDLPLGAVFFFREVLVFLRAIIEG
jgi:hypothetical protein